LSGLRCKGPYARRSGLVGIDHMAETGAHDDGHVGPYGEGFSRKVDSRHLGHGLVSNDDAEAERVTACSLP